MDLFDIFSPLAVVFTVLSVLLIFLILGLHWREDLRIRREADFRKTVMPVVENWRAGSIRLEEAMVVLKKNPPLALQLLIEQSETCEPGEIKPLQAMFKSLSSVEQMLVALKNRSPDTRLQNAQLLGYLRDESSIPGLLEALEDEVLVVRLAAAQSLAMLGCSEAVKPILLALDVPGKMPQPRVVEVLIQFGARAIDPLLAFLNDPASSDGGLAMAVRASGMLRSVRAVPRLVEALQHKAVEVRLNSVRALASIGDPVAIVPISRLAADPAWEVRKKVMLALGILKATDYIPLLVQGLTDPVWGVRFSAAEALYQMGEIGEEALTNAAGSHLDQLARNISRQIMEEHGIFPSAAKALS